MLIHVSHVLKHVRNMLANKLIRVSVMVKHASTVKHVRDMLANMLVHTSIMLRPVNGNGD